MTATEGPDFAGQLLLVPAGQTGDSPDWTWTAVAAGTAGAGGDLPDWVRLAETAGSVSSGGSGTPPPLAGMLFWVDAQAIAGAADGSPVGLWEDLTVNRRDLTQAGAGLQPLYYSATAAHEINGHPAVYGNGLLPSGSYCMTTPGWGASPPLTYALVVKPDHYTAGNSYVVGDTGVVVTGMFMFDPAGVPNFVVGGTTHAAGPALAAGVAYGLVLVWNGTASVLYVDGSARPLPAVPNTFPLAHGVTVLAQGGQSGFGGSVGEILIYGFGASPVQAAALHSYFHGKWGTA